MSEVLLCMLYWFHGVIKFSYNTKRIKREGIKERIKVYVIEKLEKCGTRTAAAMENQDLQGELVKLAAAAGDHDDDPVLQTTEISRNVNNPVNPVLLLLPAETKNDNNTSTTAANKNKSANSNHQQFHNDTLYVSYAKW